MMSEPIRLSINTYEVQYLAAKDKRLKKVIDMVGTIDYIPYSDGYQFIIHEIIEQMLSIKAGAKIFSRLNDLCNGHINPASISALTDEQLRSTGTSSNKVKYIRCFTDAINNKSLVLKDLNSLPDEVVLSQLTSIKGIGTWTAKMYLIFVLNRPDILPYEDVAFLQSYKWMYKTENTSPEFIQKKCKKWKPYTSIAARFLYKALDLGFTKQEFHLKK